MARAPTGSAMSINYDVLETMVATGVSAAQLLAVVRTMDTSARKRQADAERMRQKRAQADLFEGADAPVIVGIDVGQPVAEQLMPTVEAVMAAREVARPDATNSDEPKERKPPTPPKKEIYTTLRDRPREEPDKPLISPQAFEITEAIGAEAGYTPENWPPGWCGAAFQVQMFLNEGYDPGIIRAACTSVLRRGRGPPEHFGYFRKAIVDMRSRLEAPLPQVKPRQLEVIDGGRSDARTGFGGQRGRIVAGRAVGRNYGSVLDAAEDFREECAREAERRGEGPYRPNLVDWRTGEPRDGGLSSG